MNETKRPRSWWLREALADDPGEPCPPLERDVDADVLVIGGGYTGMWTAHFIKEAEPDRNVVLLEKDICGGGPSGRNGGFVNAFWEDIESLIEAVGEERALTVCRIGERSLTEIGEWCDLHGVDAWYTPSPHMGVSASPAQDGAWDEWVATMERLGVADGRLEILSAEQVQRVCRSPIFRAGIVTPNTALAQPARLARGLRRVLLEHGVRIHENTEVKRFRGGPPAEAETRGGRRVRAGTAVLALNAWASEWKWFRRTILPRGSYIVLTEPIPDRLEEIGWTGPEGIYDFRTTLHYLRTTPDGRIAFGAASSRAGLGSGLDGRLDYDDVSVRRITNDMRRMFPSLANVKIEAAWGGPIDVSSFHFPFFGTLSPGNVHYGLGFTGGGCGPCHLAGKVLSGLSQGADDEYTRLPLVGLRPKKFPPEPIRSVGAFLSHEAIVRKDEAEDDAKRPNPLIDFVAKLPRRLGYNIGP